MQPVAKVHIAITVYANLIPQNADPDPEDLVRQLRVEEVLIV
jgi:hypothetical protein